MRRAAPGALLLAGFLALLSTRAEAGGFKVLHRHFADGATPISSLSDDGSGWVYGTALNGGFLGCGSIFKVRKDGGGYQVLHDFACGVNGKAPASTPTLDGAGTMYGTTFVGGSGGLGTIYSMKTDGTGFKVLHDFGNGTEGSLPQATLTFDGASTLYGVTLEGGASGKGVVFKINTDGNGFGVVHPFSGSDGNRAYGQLTLFGTLLYGTTQRGGAADLGVVFRVGTDGSSYAIVHSFAGGTADGSYPVTKLFFLQGAFNDLYGVTTSGGTYGGGVAFRVQTNGGRYAILHNFGDTLDGSAPNGGLVRDGGGTFYGTTYQGGDSGFGTVFAMSASGASYAILHEFRPPDDGRAPQNDLLLDGDGNLFGTTGSGGASDQGTVFTMPTSGLSYARLHSFAIDGVGPNACLVSDGAGRLYGTTVYAGANGRGTLYSMKTDGSGYTLVRSFTNGSTDGGYPWAPLIRIGADTLFGTTAGGGTSNLGTVFSIKTDGTGFALLHSFLGGTSDGANSYAGLVYDGVDNLYGTTGYGGQYGYGVVFRVKTNGTGYAVLHSFGGLGDGRSPGFPLVLDGAGFLYGTTYQGGTSGDGTVFKLAVAGPDYSVLHHFTGAPDGFRPGGGVTLDGSGTLYGTTTAGGTNNYGTLFTIKTDGSAYAILHSAGPPPDVFQPNGILILDGSGGILGASAQGGTFVRGSVFRMSADGSHSTILHSFDVFDGEAPGFLSLEGGMLFGTTYEGGPNTDNIAGVDFALPACVPGDTNGDGNVDVSDAFHLINALFANGPSACNGDVNDDGALDVADVFYLLNFLFAGGPAPI
jgi:uncharacterized repeat protein (TIGR03803 family)